MTYTPRRLRPRRTPKAVLKFDRQLSAEEATQIKAEWRRAQREGLAILGPGVSLDARKDQGVLL